MKIELDTEKMKAAAQDIMSLSNELNIVLEDLFDKLSNVSKCGIWIGEAAENYIHKVNIEKKDYINFSNTIYRYGKTLNDIADDYNEKVNGLEYNK